jgi:hypothetical protein
MLSIRLFPVCQRCKAPTHQAADWLLPPGALLSRRRGTSTRGYLSEAGIQRLRLPDRPILATDAAGAGFSSQRRQDVAHDQWARKHQVHKTFPAVPRGGCLPGRPFRRRRGASVPAFPWGGCLGAKRDSCRCLSGKPGRPTGPTCSVSGTTLPRAAHVAGKGTFSIRPARGCGRGSVPGSARAYEKHALAGDCRVASVVLERAPDGHQLLS